VTLFQTYREYSASVKLRFKKRWGISWEDAGFGPDDPRMLQAFNNEESPEEFVEWLGEKYDLEEPNSWRPGGIGR